MAGDDDLVEFEGLLILTGHMKPEGDCPLIEPLFLDRKSETGGASGCQKDE